MLLSTMTNHELTSAVWQDLSVIKHSSTMDRLYEEYDKERRKKKIRLWTIGRFVILLPYTPSISHIGDLLLSVE